MDTLPHQYIQIYCILFTKPSVSMLNFNAGKRQRASRPTPSTSQMWSPEVLDASDPTGKKPSPHPQHGAMPAGVTSISAFQNKPSKKAQLPTW